MPVCPFKKLVESLHRNAGFIRQRIHRLHTCRKNPAFHADAALYIGNSFRDMLPKSNRSVDCPQSVAVGLVENAASWDNSRSV
jgi:hypothetical protein